jgi:excinuclease ABC subunit B
MLVAILDADKEGFLRSSRSLIQVAGRAARNEKGRVILYADHITDSMKALLDITESRRNKQIEYNRIHGIVPHSVRKQQRETITDVLGISGKTGANLAKDAHGLALRETPGAYFTASDGASRSKDQPGPAPAEENLDAIVDELEAEMLEAAQNLEFERAAALRDRIRAISNDLDRVPFLQDQKTVAKEKTGASARRLRSTRKK